MIAATPRPRWHPGLSRPAREAPAGAVLALAIRLADHARAMGLAVERVTATRVPNSHSHYLRLRDRWGDPWLVRVSDHPRRSTGSAGQDRPHYDLVSADALAGEPQAREWLGQVAIGMVDWTDPQVGVRQPRRKRWNCR